MFLISPLYFREKKILVNKYKTQIMCYEKNKFLFFLTSSETSIFFLSQRLIILNMTTDSLLVEKWGTLEVGRK